MVEESLRISVAELRAVFELLMARLDGEVEISADFSGPHRQLG
jgi:hypothetical protein